MSNQPQSSAQDPYAVLDAHRRRWHDQEVFLAAQLRILRQQQSANALAAALSDLRSAVPGAATVSFRMTPAGTAEPGGISGQDGKYDIEGVSETAESALNEVLHAIAQLPEGDRRALGVPAGDGTEILDIHRIVSRAANLLMRRKPDPEMDPLTVDERHVLVAAAYEGYDAYSARLEGEWEEDDWELGPVRQQQDRLALILGYGL